LYWVQKTLILHLEVSYKLKSSTSLKYSIDNAQRSANDSHKRRIVSILNAFINHIELASFVKNVSYKHKISGSIEAVVRFIDLVDQS